MLNVFCWTVQILCLQQSISVRHVRISQCAACAEVLDDFRRKEATAYQNMRHLVNDVKYVRQHIAKLFELLRQVGISTSVFLSATVDWECTECTV